MDINCNIIRGRPTFSNKAASRDLLISSSTLFILYTQYMEINKNLLDIEIQNPINSSQLSYKGNAEIGDLVSKMTDKSPKEEAICIK